VTEGSHGDLLGWFGGEARCRYDGPISSLLAEAGKVFKQFDLQDSGCIIYDFAAKDVRLCDFDNYNLGPFILDRDRNYGSSRFMAPEEFVRGRTIDARTNVYTMGRTASVILADACPETDNWRGPRDLLDVVDKATRVAPEDRYQTVGEFCTAWISACDAAGLGR
jgi:serine/threonine protein kinase